MHGPMYFEGCRTTEIIRYDSGVFLKYIMCAIILHGPIGLEGCRDNPL